jgi:EF-P beta-lysylation protein EpmB
MQKGNPRDPLLLQVLATAAELLPAPGFSDDPLAERSFNPVPGVVHKYPGRLLLTLTGSCPINCRYCFRRHFPYALNNPGRLGWQKALEYIAATDSVHEVILSGGEPLMATDILLNDIINGLSAIPHIKTLRIHTRMPVVLPERIDDALLALLTATHLQRVVVLHTNHAHELSPAVEAACSRLAAAGCHLLSQSVLLKDINDDVDRLVALSHRLFACGVLPYYLHCLDPVQGAAHFDVDDATAYALFQAMQKRLPGYLVPRLVREKAGGASKIAVTG